MLGNGDSNSMLHCFSVIPSSGPFVSLFAWVFCTYSFVVCFELYIYHFRLGKKKGSGKRTKRGKLFVEPKASAMYKGKK